MTTIDADWDERMTAAWATFDDYAEAAGADFRAVIDALNRLETVGTHILGVVLTKAAGRGGNYGGYGYGYGHAYGKGARLKRTEILMIPKESDAGSEARDD